MVDDTGTIDNCEQIKTTDAIEEQGIILLYVETLGMLLKVRHANP